MQGGGGSRLSRTSNLNPCDWTKITGTGTAFTMAEILLSLTIIGVVAAITLPSLTGNINERTWNTQRKALYARMSQALPLMDALNGYGTFKAASGTEGTDSYDAGMDNCAETFVTAGLAKVMKINNICDSEHLADCGIPTEINTLKGNKLTTPTTFEALNAHMVVSNGAGNNSFSMYKTKAAAFETQNGESIIVYYNPTCLGSLDELPFTADSSGGGYYIQQRVCANFIYDLNGTKGPNTVNKDIGFMTVMYPFDAMLYAPIPATKPLDGTFVLNKGASKHCTDMDSEYRAPQADELASMFVNKNLIEASSYTNSIYLSSQIITTPFYGGFNNLSQNIINGIRDDNGRGGIWCIKR